MLVVALAVFCVALLRESDLAAKASVICQDAQQLGCSSLMQHGLESPH